MPTRLTRAEQRDLTRTRLLESAERLFVEQGFHGTSVDQIAEEAGYSKGAVYSNFGNKDELFLALLENRVDSVAMGIEVAVDRSRDIGAQVEQAGSGFAELYVGGNSKWSLLLMEFSAHAARHDDLRERFAARNRSMRATMTRLIDEHLEPLGLTPPIPSSQLATILFALGQGYIIEKLVDPQGVPDDLFTSALAMLFSGFTKA